ncbi:hypothetical protein RHMOL_Rhmol11G0253000 [Rhododendron molle]|uniref:Uncharacterized protein n=1 Tax=Rhododendron molle TaxID=49168 RepID=A0ACC0LX13_RHOML|nr:hypothetical protein RHMOL_Rhmol11G0253000 [Rhododendron molle]
MNGIIKGISGVPWDAVDEGHKNCPYLQLQLLCPFLLLMVICSRRSQWPAGITVSRPSGRSILCSFLSEDYITLGVGVVPVAKHKAVLPTMGKTIVVTNIVVMVLMMVQADAWDTNPVFDPCSDTKIQRGDGFTFGLAFSMKESFLFNQTQLSPCDQRLSLSQNNAQLAVFRPRVDEISLLTINSTTFNPTMAGGYMVAFAGWQYAARSVPVFVADNTNTITSFTLVLEFQKGTLQNLYWKKFGCDSCSGKSVVCLNNQDCAIQTSQCKASGGPVDCNLGIQLAFSGTDKNNNVFNSWYEVANLRQYSLFALYSNLRNTLTGPFTNLL